MQVKPGAHTPRRSIKTILKMLFCCPSAYCIPYLRSEEVSCIQAFSAASFLNQQEVSEHTDLGRSEKVQRVFSHSLWSPFAVLLRVRRGWLRRPQCHTLPIQPEVHQHSERCDFPEIPEPSGRRGSGSRRGTERRFPHSGASERKTCFAS